jgi:sulfur carrier protein ThiS adenylyltransferase
MAGLDSANTILTRRIAKNFWLCGDGKSDVGEGLGLISARVAVCAAHQATMVLRIISGEYYA